jgi:ribosomal protein S18 acetylase RimI-like enzyme
VKATLRAATERDFPQMYATTLAAHCYAYPDLIPNSHRANFDERYTFSTTRRDTYVAKMTRKLSSPAWHIWVAEVDHDIVGYTLWQEHDDASSYLHGLFINPRYFGRGIGSQLFEKSIESGQAIYLSVLENNSRAKRLYEKYDFVPIGHELKSFFGVKETIMKRA